MLDDHERSSDTMGTGLVVGAILVLFAIAGTALAQQVQALGPSVGDIIRFHPGGEPPQDLRRDVRAYVTDPADPAHPPATCSLSVPKLIQSGGSIVVEAVDPNRPASFRIHWAGGPTGDDKTACAGEANLFVSQDALITLATAAGGFGAGDNKEPAGILPETVFAYGQ
jgi:hypothetical protein